MRIYTNYSEIDKNQWQKLIDESLTASYFQTPESFSLFDSLSFTKPFVFAVSENEKLTGLINGYITADGNFIKRFFSRRAIVCGGALLSNDISKDALLKLLITTRNELKTKAIYFEFRNYNDYSDYKSVFESCGFEYSPHLNFHVNTPDVETILKNLNITKRRDVKISRNEGVKWNLTNKIEDITEFYILLEELYRLKVKTPLFPLEFFLKLNQTPHAKLFVLKYNDQIIGGSQCVELPDKTLYEWFVCGMDGKFKNVYPSTVATWAGIEYAAENGFKKFDMMGAGKPDTGYGVREFKSKFGGELVEHGRFIYISKPFLYKIGKFVIGLMRNGFKLPSFRNHKLERKSNKQQKTTSGIKIISDIKQIDKKKWSDFVIKHPNGNIFQSPELYEVYKNTGNLRPVILLAVNVENKVVGCLMSVIQREKIDFTGLFTSRSIITGGPLSQNDDLDIAILLLEKYKKLVKSKTIYSQFRNLFDVKVMSKAFETNKFEFNEHLDILLDLTQSNEKLYENLHKERKRNIAQAEKEGLVFKQIFEKKDVLEIIELLKITYNRVRIPFAYDQLFLNAQNNLNTNIGFFAVYYNNKMIAGQVRLFYKDLAYAWYAGSDPDFLNKRPNDFLLWNVILWSKSQGYKVFDFGGAGVPNVPYGVRDYKLKFGGELVDYGRYELTHKKLLMHIGEQAFKIYQKIKR